MMRSRRTNKVCLRNREPNTPSQFTSRSAPKLNGNVGARRNEMTNGMDFVSIIHRNPLDPMIMPLAGLWLVALCVSVASVVVAIIRIAKRRSVLSLANLNIMTAMILGLCSLAIVLWMFERVVEIRMTADMTPSMSQMMVYYWTAPIMQLAVSAIVCGINLVIGMALHMKWKEPQHASAP